MAKSHAPADRPGKSDAPQLIVKNRRATFDYDIDDRFEAGIELVGSEVKSMRAGKVDVTDAYVSVDDGQAWLKQLFVAPFEQASAFPHEPRRARRLLLHAREIEAIHQSLAREGATAVPLRLYFKQGRVKVEVGVGKGKKTYDKRADIAKKDAEREARQSARAASRQGGGAGARR
jgi:SsrA-binding protein